MKWQHHNMARAFLAANMSKDPSTQVGAVIIGPDRESRSDGYNGFPRDMEDSPELYANRPFKYEHILHAESNALMNALRAGTSVKDCVMYVTHPPCPHCAGLIKQAGIVKVVYQQPGAEFLARWPLEKTRAHFERIKLPLEGVSCKLPL